MGYKLLTLTIALTLALTETQADIPCPFEECSCDRWRIDCQNRGLTSLPVLKNGSFPQTRLLLRNNQLTQIPELGYLHNLKYVYLNSNKIRDGPAVSLPDSLQRLDLGYNQLTHIPAAVATLNELTRLRLSNNNIRDISTFMFPSSLEWLDLYHNEIENISSISFQNETSALTFLNLYWNSPLSHISDDAFSQLTKLEELYFSYTRLTRLPLALMTLTHLTDLDIRYNRNMACTCDEAALAKWYHDLPKKHLHFLGDCYDGNTVENTVVYYLAEVAPYCVKPCV